MPYDSAVDAADAQRDALALMLRRAELDDLDRRLVEALQADGRRSTVDLARDLGTSTKTVKRRVDRLLDSGIIRITAVTTPEALGYGAIALVGVELDGTRLAADVAAEFARLAEADYVVVATGRFAIYCELFCRDTSELGRVVDERIRAADGVRAAEIIPYLSLHYQQAQFAVARQPGVEAGAVRPVRLEPLDRAIIGALTEDGRRPFLQIAHALGVSEAQVRQRFKAITDRGVARVMAIANPLGLGYTTTAWVAVQIDTSQAVRDVADRLSQLPAVTYVAICAGRFDIFAEVVCTSTDELLRLLEDDIRTIRGIISVETSLYLDLHYKRLVPLDVV